MRARIAAHARWANTTPTQRQRAAEAGQDGLLERFRREVDPDCALTPDARERLARNAQRSHMARLALNSSRKRVPT